MPKEEWGVKRVCPNCSTRFYDLQRDPMVCPSCGHSFSADSLAVGKARTLVADKSDANTKAKAKEEETEETTLVEDDDVELDDDLLDDDDDEGDVSLEEIADVPADDDD